MNVEDLLQFISASSEDHQNWAVLVYNFKIMGGQ